MIHYFDIAGHSAPADFSIMTLAQLAQKYGSDMTGLAEVFLVVHHPVVEFMTGSALVTAAEVALFWGKAGDMSPFDDEDVALVETEISVDDC